MKMSEQLGFRVHRVWGSCRSNWGLGVSGLDLG